MKIVTAEEMRAIDRATTEKYGVPSLTLMENAGTPPSLSLRKSISNWAQCAPSAAKAITAEMVCRGPQTA